MPTFLFSAAPDGGSGDAEPVDTKERRIVLYFIGM